MATARMLTALAWLSALLVCNADAGTTYFNLYCTYEDQNELVCILDAKNSHSNDASDYHKDGASFCGAKVTCPKIVTHSDVNAEH